MKFGFWQKVRAVFNESAWDEMVRAFLTGDDYPVGDDINVKDDKALKFTAVYGCLRVLAETFASVPCFEYHRLEDGNREKTDDTGLYDLLHSAPNEEMSAFAFKEMGMYQVNMGGNLVCSIRRNLAGEIRELYPYEWKRVEITRDKTTQRLKYIVDNNENYTYNRRTVFHVAGPSLNGVIGMSPLEYAAQAIRLGVTYEKFGVNFYKNGALSTGLFKHPTSLKDEGYKRLKEDLKKNWQGLVNAGKPMLLEDNMDYKELTIKPLDAQLIESKRFQIEDICRIYRVPLHLVQELSRSTNNNIEHQSLEFVMYTMLPWFKRWEDAINTQLLTPEERKKGYYFEFNVSSLLRGDQQSMARAFATGRQWGWLSVNDIRRLLNMNRVENGDIYLQPVNMVEAGTPPAPVEGSDAFKRELENVYSLIERSKKCPTE